MKGVYKMLIKARGYLNTNAFQIVKIIKARFDS